MNLPLGDCGSVPQIISAAPMGEPEWVVVGSERGLTTVCEVWFSGGKLSCRDDSAACWRCSCCNCCCCWKTKIENKLSIKLWQLKTHYLLDSWVSRDVINFTGGQLQIDTLSSDWKNFHYMCWPCVWQQMRAISWDLLAPVQYNHQYILGWPPLRITEKGSSETQE